MLKDIPELKVEDIALAVVPEENSQGYREWSVYLLNLKRESIQDVLVTSKGYGFKDGEKVKTSALRHFFEAVSANDFVKIEPIMENVFGLNNEFWVSFYQHKKMYDKKYLFLPDTINEEFFTHIPLLNKSGVMIK